MDLSRDIQDSVIVLDDIKKTLKSHGFNNIPAVIASVKSQGTPSSPAFTSLNRKDYGLTTA